MIIRKSFKYRLRPNRKQAELCSQFAGACRWIYNRGLDQRKEAWEKEHRSIGLYDQNIELVKLKADPKTAWLKEVHSQVLQQALGDLHSAYQHFFRRVKNGEKPGYPRFRVRGERDSFRFPQGFKLSGERVYLPKIGWVRFRSSRPIEGEIKQVTVLREGDHWYVSFSCEIQAEDQPFATSPSTIGIDVGLENFAVIASELGIDEVSNPRFLQRDLSHLRYLSRQVSKKQKGSKSWKEAKRGLAAFHAKIRARRTDFLHKLSTQLVKSHDLIVVESLKIQSMLMNAPKSLARAISDAGWGQFLRFLHYKCEYFCKRLLEAGEWFPSTKQCHRCGSKQEMALSDRRYVCSCGVDIHRDHNSALLLRSVGTTGKKACGAAFV